MSLQGECVAQYHSGQQWILYVWGVGLLASTMTVSERKGSGCVCISLIIIIIINNYNYYDTFFTGYLCRSVCYGGGCGQTDKRHTCCTHTCTHTHTKWQSSPTHHLCLGVPWTEVVLAYLFHQWKHNLEGTVRAVISNHLFIIIYPPPVHTSNSQRTQQQLGTALVQRQLTCVDTKDPSEPTGDEHCQYNFISRPFNIIFENWAEINIV